MSAGTFNDFLVALGKEESGDNYSYVSSPGYLGYYQFAEVTMEYLGWFKGDGTGVQNWVGTWTSAAGQYGVTSKEGFLASPAAQNAAELQRMAQIDGELQNLGLLKYVGQSIHGVNITLSGLMAGATLVGSPALATYLNSGGATMPHDYNNTTVENYIQWFGGYQTPYDSQVAGSSATPPPPTTTPADPSTTTPPPTTTTPTTPPPTTTPSTAPVAGVTLTSGASGQALEGGTGADTLTGGDGANTLHGGAGNDSISAGIVFNQINGNQGDDTIVGHSHIGDWLLGGQGSDSISASASTGHNLIYGNLGNDTLVGGTGGDTLRGGQGDDVIHAGSGNDWISGDLGNNTIAGGSGNDTFHGSAGHDVISGWHAGDHVQVDAGVTYTVSQSGADVHVDLSNGGQLVLQGVTQTSLQSGWIFTV